MHNKKKIKVIFVIGSNLGIGRGSEVCLLNYIKYAPLDRFDITIIQNDSSSENRIDSRTIENLTQKIKLITIKDTDNIQKISNNIQKISNKIHIVFFYDHFIRRVFFRLYRITNKTISDELKQADIIYFDCNNNNVLLASGCKAIKIGSIHCFSPIEYLSCKGIEGFLHKLDYKMLSRKLDGWHIFPEYSNFNFMSNKNYNLILGNGVDTKIFYPLDKKRYSNKKIKLFFVANLAECKGINVVLDAWKVIADKSRFELHIAGGGELSEEVKRRAKSEGFIYHGIIKTQDLAQLYRESDIFLYPSNCDMLPLVVLEALSSGLYVITSDYLKKAFDDFEKLGYLEYIKRDPDQLAKRVEEVANNKKILNRNRKKQYQYLKDNYDWSEISHKLFEWFSKIVNQDKIGFRV